ncbi:MAG TPA: efflux RND transporter periplasmic adaptor subunit [Candidatus Sulfotelmatobacter sp.]|nr:efflux RND transporter periplasmic adaptor subunit [Candidatus Sulfotelmatobacter sp.]
MRKAIVVLVLLAVGGGAAWVAYRHESTRAAVPKGEASRPLPVTDGVAETRDMPVYVRGIGTVQAYNMVTIKSRVDGQIMKVDFTEGQEVKAGDLLFEIDPRPFQAAVAQAAANKQKDEAQLVSATADLKRDADLLPRGFQTAQAYDQQKALVGQIQASIKADQAAIDTANLNLQYADIRSPINGRTGALLVDVGNLVHATDNTGLVTITQLRPIFVSFTVPQDQFDRIRQSQSRGQIVADAMSDDDTRQLAAGKLTLIDNQIDQSTGTLHLKATFDNQNETLWPGEFVDMRLVVAIDKNAVTVPARSVEEGPNGNYLFVIKPDMTVEMRPVQVAQVEQGLAVISKGLAAGERIVVDGQYALEQGKKVAPRAATAVRSG